MIGSCMIPGNLGEIIKDGTEVGIDDEGGAKTVEVGMKVVAIDSLLNFPSSMLTFVSLLHKFTMMCTVQTSFGPDSVFETPDGLTVSFSGILMFC